jgi:hypothetical protein
MLSFICSSNPLTEETMKIEVRSQRRLLECRPRLLSTSPPCSSLQSCGIPSYHLLLEARTAIRLSHMTQRTSFASRMELQVSLDVWALVCHVLLSSWLITTGRVPLCKLSYFYAYLYFTFNSYTPI